MSVYILVGIREKFRESVRVGVGVSRCRVKGGTNTPPVLPVCDHTLAAGWRQLGQVTQHTLHQLYS